MKLLQSDNNFCNIETNLLFGEVIRFVQMRKEFSSLDKLKNNVELLRCLECIMHRYQKWAVNDFLQNLSLSSGVFGCLLFQSDLLLLQDLHGVQLAFINAIQLFNEKDPSVGPCTQQLDEPKVLNADLLASVQFDCNDEVIKLALAQNYV